jgi:hypothetical protein
MNPHRGEVEVTLADGKTYLLKFNNNAIAHLEQLLGANGQPLGIAYILQNFQRLLGLDFLAKALRAGLTHDEACSKWRPAKFLELVPPDFEAATMAVVRGILSWRGLEVENAAESQEVSDTKVNPQ